MLRYCTSLHVFSLCCLPLHLSMHVSVVSSQHCSCLASGLAAKDQLMTFELSKLVMHFHWMWAGAFQCLLAVWSLIYNWRVICLKQPTWALVSLRSADWHLKRIDIWKEKSWKRNDVYPAGSSLVLLLNAMCTCQLLGKVWSSWGSHLHNSLTQWKGKWEGVPGSRVTSSWADCPCMSMLLSAHQWVTWAIKKWMQIPFTGMCMFIYWA